uniref:RING-type E3 ubiquitin transferase n=1 Tax=Bruguiera gymnorhiza TaxID=39984 RepID=Q93XR9_BRUGY|nr:bg55 [Bruguiera gymnorhiza]
MGTDAGEVVETLPHCYSCKVHQSICRELRKVVDRIERLFPNIEASRPRCRLGIEVLCLLNDALDRAKQVLQYCSESSKLYLALNGDVIVSRCQKSRNLLEQSLDQIQTMVPVILAAEISQVIDDLRVAKFVLDHSDEEAGKAVRELLQQHTSMSDAVESEIKVLRFAASRLCITTPKDLLIEKRSIKKLVNKVRDNDPTKKKILIYLLHLLKKYGNSILGEQGENLNSQQEELFADGSSVSSQAAEVGPCTACKQIVAEAEMSNIPPAPPEEYKCPLSKRLMYDPVVIASGQTFERIWIQKWFDEGNDTCPKTLVKLDHQSLMPNTALKDLISKWCEKYGVTILDPNSQAFQSLDTSSTSVASFGISMNDLHLPLDISNVSLGSSDASYCSDSPRTKIAERSNLMSMQRNNGYSAFQSRANTNKTCLDFLSRLAKLGWESKCEMIEDVKSHLEDNVQPFHHISFENFVEPLIKFLRDAKYQHDVRAQRAGSKLLLAFVSKKRSGISWLHEDTFDLLASMLDSELVEEALAILEVLSSDKDSRSKITASGALVYILRILDSEREEFQEGAVRILHNLSSNNEVCSQILSLNCIPKLVPFINQGQLASHCMGLLKNLCDIEDARVSVAETNGCVAAIAKLLERESCEEQDHAVAILLSLCSQRVQYCNLVMDEGVIPSLFVISINGSEKGKASALELLRQLRDVDFDNEQKCSGYDVGVTEDSHQCKEKKISSRKTRFLGISLFSNWKSSSVASKKKR